MTHENDFHPGASSENGQWIALVRRHVEILVTDRGEAVARLTSEAPHRDVPYFARRLMTPSFRKLARGGKLTRGADSTVAVSEDR